MIAGDEPARTIALLHKYNIMPRKKFGQNFLIDNHVIEKIVGAAGITKDDCVLEIGPGIGTLTRIMAQRAGKVIAVEIDRDLAGILKEDVLKDFDNVTIVNDDVLKLDIPQVLKDEGVKGPVKVVANLPYYITTPIIMALLEKNVPMISMTVMIQKEVAQRINAPVGGKEYGALTLAVAYHATSYIAANVPSNCFIPRPGVASAVIRLDVLDKPPVSVKNEKFMFDLIRAAFNQRRKTLGNAVGNYMGGVCTREQTQEGLEKIGFPALARGETLGLDDFAKLADILYTDEVAARYGG